jgi:CheY-like chemotaxis protein
MAKDSNKTIVYSALEVANICGVVNQTAINWIRNGYLTAFSTPGGQYRVYLDDLIEFMTKRKIRVPAELLEASGTCSAEDKSILIVDDDRGLNSVLSKFLLKEFPDIEVYQAFDGFEAGALLADKKPKYVIMDLNLPGLDGFSLCKRIKESDEFGKPFVFVITSLQEDDVEERIRSLGITDFMRKPLNLVEVAEAFRKQFK